MPLSIDFKMYVTNLEEKTKSQSVKRVFEENDAMVKHCRELSTNSHLEL